MLDRSVIVEFSSGDSNLDQNFSKQEFRPSPLPTTAAWLPCPATTAGLGCGPYLALMQMQLMPGMADAADVPLLRAAACLASPPLSPTSLCCVKSKRGAGIERAFACGLCGDPQIVKTRTKTPKTRPLHVDTCT